MIGRSLSAYCSEAPIGWRSQSIRRATASPESGPARLRGVTVDLAPCLQPTVFIGSEHPAVVETARGAVGESDNPTEVARRLFYWVRYEPHQEFWNAGIYRASHTLEQRAGYCVQKAVLLAAMARASGVPARLGFADIRNHKTPPQMLEIMGTNLYVYHGYAELHLNGEWLKVTPAFDDETYERSGALTVEFDGEVDATLHPVDPDGQPHMEYVRYRGSYADVPVEEILRAFQETYVDGRAASAASNNVSS